MHIGKREKVRAQSEKKEEENGIKRTTLIMHDHEVSVSMTIFFMIFILFSGLVSFRQE